MTCPHCDAPIITRIYEGRYWYSCRDCDDIEKRSGSGNPPTRKTPVRKKREAKPTGG
jgi:hypothetical protein